MSITLPLAETIRGEMEENLVDGKDLEGMKKGIYSVFGNGNAQGLQEDGDKLAAALEEWLKEGKIKVRFGFLTFPHSIHGHNLYHIRRKLTRFFIFHV